MDYNKIYNYLETRHGKITSAANIANAIGAERVYGATMSKLVREGMLEPCAEKGYYRVV